MRSTTTASQAQALASLRDLSTHVRVSVDNGSGSYQDLTDLEGYNWVHSVEYSESAGEAVAKATVRLFRESHRLSLSPFMDGSKLNASGAVIDIARKILIETAVLPAGKVPASDEWEKVFHGYIRKVAWNRSPIVLTCLDLGSEIMKWYVETQRIYALAADEWNQGFMVVVQDLVDDNNPALDTIAADYTWNGFGSTTVNTLDTSEIVVGDYIGFGNGTLTNRGPFFRITAIVPNTSATVDNSDGRTMPSGNGAGSTAIIPAADRITLYGVELDASVKGYYQSPERVLSACRNITQQVGYEVSYRWNNSTSDFELSLWRPNRVAASPDFTLDASMYKGIGRLDIDDSNIRNAIRVTGEVSGTRVTYTREDATSIAKYGRAFMAVTEDASSQIDTVAELQDFGDIILLDLKDPGADAVVTIPYRWDLEIGDYGRFEANGVHFDSDQDLGVVGLKHTIPNKGEPITTITVRGKPSGGVKRWLELEGMPGVAPPTDLKSDVAAENAAAVAGVGRLEIEYDDPRTMSPAINDWAYTECYVHTADPGDPPNSSYLRAVGRQTRFVVGGLTPGVTYYVRLVIIDEAGNPADTSVVVSEATQQIGPYHENPAGQFDQLCRNNDFNIFTLGTASPPDFWSVAQGSWASDFAVNTNDSATGAKAIDFDHSGTAPHLKSGYIPVAGGASVSDILQAAVIARYVSGTTPQLILRLKWYTRAKAYISTYATTYTLASSYASYQLVPVLAPSNAAFVVVQLEAITSSSVVRVDRVSLLRSYANGHVEDAFGIAGNAGSLTYVQLEWDSTVDIDADDIGVTHGQDSSVGNYRDFIEIIYPGLYLISFHAYSYNTSGHFSLYSQIGVDQGGGYAAVAEQSGDSYQWFNYGTDYVFSAPILKLDKGDKIRVQSKVSTVGTAHDMAVSALNVRQLVRMDQ